MRRACPSIAAMMLVVLAIRADGVAQEVFESAHQSAMVQYYAALLTSARDDADGTLRRLVLLQARWEKVAQATPADGPTWARGAPPAPSVITAVAAQIEAARRRVLSRDVAGAHAELEAVRVLLRDARARAGVRTVDDAVTDYHDGMERLISRVGERNEITLTAEDFGAIEEQAGGVQAAWAKAVAAAETSEMATRWRDLAGRTTATLAKLQAAAAARDSAAAQSAAQSLKRLYYDLLAVLARG